jgi:hypothetical protein
VSTGNKFIVATMTWDNGPIFDLWLDHYRRLGATAALVLDLGSTDGTLERRDAAARKGFVHALDLPTLAETRRSDMLLDYAKEHFPGDCWCQFCDPDEFFVTRTPGQIDPACDEPRVGLVTIPRRNVTAPRSVARNDPDDITPLGALTLRIDGRHAWDSHALNVEGPLDPPWIFAAIEPKVLVQLDAVTSVTEGDHAVALAEGRSSAEATQAYLLHYPFRTFDDFQHKVELASEDFATNDWPPWFGWQYRRWFRAREHGALLDEYLDQFVDDERIPALLESGVLVQDTAVRDFYGAR